MTATQALACKVDNGNLRRVDINWIVVHRNLNRASHNKSNAQNKLARILTWKQFNSMDE